MGQFPLTLSYLQNKDQNSLAVQSLIMSIDLHCNGKNSFYSNLIKMLNYYDISFNFNHDTLDDTKITYLVDQMKKKYIAYMKHSLCNSQKLKQEDITISLEVTDFALFVSIMLKMKPRQLFQ